MSIVEMLHWFWFVPTVPNKLCGLVSMLKVPLTPVVGGLWFSRKRYHIYIKNQPSVFCSFLDAYKAFDRVQYCKLFRLILVKDNSIFLPPDFFKTMNWMVLLVTLGYSHLLLFESYCVMIYDCTSCTNKLYLYNHIYSPGGVTVMVFNVKTGVNWIEQ